MSEIEKKREMEDEEKEMLDHWSHRHPLTLVDTTGRDECYGCERSFSSGEQAYGCSVMGCKYSMLLHEECAATVREIRHPLHTHHILSQRHGHELLRCICKKYIFTVGYKCTSSGCTFQVHLRCAQDEGVTDASHHSHDLKLLRRRCPFKCDACGTTRSDGSYICTKDDCQYLIHQKCGSLPQYLKREDHHHPLSLSSCIPQEYFRFNYKCDVCSEILRLKYWIYHCRICRFIVHVKCAFNKPPPPITDASIGKDVVRLPMNEVSVELITPFVMRQRGGEGETKLIPPIIIPAAAAIDELVNVKYKFLHHQHELTLVSSTSQHPQIIGEEEDEENYGVRSELICDGCITPISSYYYMSCSECKYNLHLACFHMPPQLSSLPLHQHDDHHLLLQSCDKRRPWEMQHCSLCRYGTNGLFYTCTKCDFVVDIKCACMPDTIHHAAHPQHLLKYVTKSDLCRDIIWWSLTCAAGCGKDIDDYDCYRCCSNSPCDFIVHVRCAVLPASVSSRRWDEHHPLLLTNDATLNRPGDFYCDQCETQMNPRTWMYRCRSCDISFHPKCFPTTSGEYRNMKFGQECHVDAETHPHPLTFQLLTTKRRCDICRCNKNEDQGFYCALCNFFICLYLCGRRMIAKGHLKAVDLEKLSVLDY
ncbi:uncharacterized protein LOC125204583 isoform X2 [Salvia hispanica]|uniref:uncharacterized protein LOC125204583 isoform X2 n=1 Tax=Salvia hispanica TaxID=49212 RepID=UPI002008FBB8|nr:uncharacterized protein LOC125204583 isoform X2 [Salvia hispanica]